MPVGTRITSRQRLEREVGELIAHILKNSNDFYKVLKVRPQASDAAIRKAFRTLSMRVHPDRCNLDGAVDAQKMLERVRTCLSSPVSRAHYDATGLELGQRVPGLSPLSSYSTEQDFFLPPRLVVVLCVVLCVMIGMAWTLRLQKQEHECLSLDSPFGRQADKRVLALPSGTNITFYIHGACYDWPDNRVRSRVQQMYVNRLELQCHEERQRLNVNQKRDLATIPVCREIFDIRAYI